MNVTRKSRSNPNGVFPHIPQKTAQQMSVTQKQLHEFSKCSHIGKARRSHNFWNEEKLKFAFSDH